MVTIYQPPSGLNEAEVTAIASGAAQNLQQSLLASGGALAQTVLAVAFTSWNLTESGLAENSAQIASLGDGNVVFVYANGQDFLSNTVQEGPIFLGLGEIYVIQNVTSGTIITASEGAYGYSNQFSAGRESPMPLLSLGLAFTDSFLFGFRNSATYRGGAAGSRFEGWIHVVSGPLAASVTLATGAGAVVQGQENITVPPWAYRRLYTDGNQEYRLTATNPIMAAVQSDMGTLESRFEDSRLVMPVTNDGIGWPRRGDLSAPFAGTEVRYFVNDGTNSETPSVNRLTASPGSPVDLEAAYPGGTGNDDDDYQQTGATRFLAAGLISAYSGADSAGNEATPLCPTANMTQRLALPIAIALNGDGGTNGIAIASPFRCTAIVYEWDPVAGVASPVTFNVPAALGGGTTTVLQVNRTPAGFEPASSAFEQLFPGACLISPDAPGSGSDGLYNYQFQSAFSGGYVECTAPSLVIFNATQNANGGTLETFRGTAGAAVPGISADGDEQLTFGIIPDTIRAEIVLGTDGLLYRRSITGGVETWEVA